MSSILAEGFVLAGGASTRYGSDKALVTHRGRTLIEHAIAALDGLGVPPRVVGPDVERYRAFADAFVTAERPGLGPVEGLRVALSACGAPWALVLGADMPEVDADALRVLVENAVSGDARIVCFEDSAKRRHPLPGVYDVVLADEPLLAQGNISLKRLLDTFPTRVITAAETSIDIDRVLHNVNRPDDLGMNRD